jgi:hypothetical protein
MRERVAVQEQQRRAAASDAQVDPRARGFDILCLKALKHKAPMSADETPMNADDAKRCFVQIVNSAGTLEKASVPRSSAAIGVGSAMHRRFQ